MSMITAVPDPDDEPGRDDESQAHIEDTLYTYRRFLDDAATGQVVTGPPGTGKTDLIFGLVAERRRAGEPVLLVSTQRVVDVEKEVEHARESLQSDASGRALTPLESMELQRELLADIAEVLMGQREDVRRGEAKALDHQRRAFRVAAWSLGVAALALLAPIVEIVLKLLGVDL